MKYLKTYESIFNNSLERELEKCKTPEDQVFVYIEYNKFDEFKKLIEQGVDVNTKTKYDESLIMYASIYNCYEIFDYLLSNGCNPDGFDFYRSIYSAINTEGDILKKKIRNG